MSRYQVYHREVWVTLGISFLARTMSFFSTFIHGPPIGTQKRYLTELIQTDTHSTREDEVIPKAAEIRN